MTVEIWNVRGGAPFATMSLESAAAIYGFDVAVARDYLEKYETFVLSKYHYLKKETEK